MKNPAAFLGLHHCIGNLHRVPSVPKSEKFALKCYIISQLPAPTNKWRKSALSQPKRKGGEMAGKWSLRLSKSSGGSYLDCPRSYWFPHILGLPGKTDCPRLMGHTVHQFVAKMHKSNRNPLYYQNIDNARRAWFWTWKRALEENADTLIVRSNEKSSDYGRDGWFCINNYWKQNIDKPAPLYVEKRYEVPLFPRVTFVGIVDQIRMMPTESIAKIRPELIVNGRLKEGYDPVAIIDLKTGKESYDPRRFDPNISDLALAAHQFELHEDLQVTAYYWLYYQVYKKLPVAFYWYHLRDGKAFMTYRNKNDFGTFLEIMEYIVSGIKDESYPPHFGRHCKRCDFFKECGALNPDRPLMTTEPADGIESGGEVKVWPRILPVKPRQLKLNFPKR